MPQQRSTNPRKTGTFVREKKTHHPPTNHPPHTQTGGLLKSVTDCAPSLSSIQTASRVPFEFLTQITQRPPAFLTIPGIPLEVKLASQNVFSFSFYVIKNTFKPMLQQTRLMSEKIWVNMSGNAQREVCFNVTGFLLYYVEIVRAHV